MACVELNSVVTFDDSCPTVKIGPLDKMFATRATVTDQLPSDFDLTDLNDRIDNAAADGDPVSGAAPIREFTIIGGTAERETSSTPLPLGDTLEAPGNKVWTFEIYDLTAANLAWAAAISARGSVKKKVWFQGGVDMWVGGYQGMNGTMKADIVFATDRTTPVKIVGSFTTRASLNTFSTTLLPTYP